VLMAGQILARAAARVFSKVLFSPSYGTARRGGFTECTVSFSNDAIASPWVSKAGTVILFEPSSLGAYEAKVQAGGTLLIEAAGLKESKTRQDIRMVTLPVVRTALDFGNSQMTNVIFLGAYTQIEKCVPQEVIEEELERTFQAKEKALKSSLVAFREGIRLADVALGKTG